MIAQSFVVVARAVDRRAAATLEQPRIGDDRRSRDAGLAQLADLRSIDTLLEARGTLPVPETSPSRVETETVTSLLSRMFETGPLERAELDDSRLTAVAETPRVRLVGGYLIVPLGSEPPTDANWRPLCRFLADGFDGLAAKLERIVARLEGELSEPTPALRIWRSALETVRETRSVLKIQLARQERIRRLYTRPSDDPVTFAKWTLDRLSNTPRNA
jgi:hypothetical protein